MSTATLAMPPVGQRVTVTEGSGLPAGAIGATGTVVGEYRESRPFVMFDDPIEKFGGRRPDGCEGSWVITGWDIVLPSIGDKVIPLPDNGDWHFISPEYRTAVGTITDVGRRHALTGRALLSAEFQSYSKPDDTIRWSFYYWKPADGHTLTVSDPYVPSVGDKVQISGYLSNEGIIDTVKHDGYIRAVDDDVWTIDSPLYGRQVSGPGYITLVLPAVEVEAEDAEDVPAPRQGEIDELTRQLERANERVREYADRAGKWERDFMRSWERMGREARDRRWCSEYEEITEDLQGDMEIATIPERPKSRIRKTRRVQATTYIDITYFEAEDEDSTDPDDWFTDATGDEVLGTDGVKEKLRDEYQRMGDFDEFDYDPE